MNRPDLDALERTCGDCCETVAEVVAYARHLERQLLNEVEYVNIQNEDFGKLLIQAQVYARHLEARISELEAALSELLIDLSDVDDRNPYRQSFLNAARVLRKGAQCDAITHETWCEDDRPCAYHDGPKAAP